MLVFVEGGKLENQKKFLKHSGNQHRSHPKMAPGRNQTQTTMVGDERSRHCSIAAPHLTADTMQLT